MSYTPVEVSPDPTTTNNATSTEERPYSHNHHHHHNKHKDSSYYHRIRDGSWGAWICIGFFGIFFLTTIILLIVYGVQWNNTNNHMYAIEAKMAKENTRLTNNGIYTVSNSATYHKIPYDLTRCHMEMYKLSDNTDNPQLLPINNSIGRERENTYLARVVLSMNYNVEAEKLLIEGFKGRGHGKYFVLNYEFLTNYPEFSTIRLVESNLDIFDKSLLPTKDIILCSNDPSKRRDAPRCSRMTTADDIMVLNNTDFFPMESSSLAPTSRDEQEDVEEDVEEEVVFEDDITDYRFYEIYCYRETDDKDDDFIEYLSLIIKPTNCN